jgi:two-component system NtrC family sensor kinase
VRLAMTSAHCAASQGMPGISGRNSILVALWNMRFRTRILLALITVGVAPLVLAGALAYRANRDEVLGAVGRAQAQAAQDLARECEQFVLGAVDHLSASAGYLPLAQLPPGQVRDVLGIPYRQLRWVNAVVLLSERGTAVGEPVFEPVTTDGSMPTQRERIGAAELDAFSSSIPLATALASDVAIGQPYRGPRSGVPRIAIAVRIDGPPRRVLAAELSLRELAARLEEIASAGDAVYLLDARGAIVAHGASGAALSRDERELADRGIASLQPSVRSIVREDGKRWLAAFAPVGTMGWGVVLARPESVALRAVERARAYTLFWAGIALALAIALAWLLARDLTVPIRMLSDAVRALTEGRHRTPIPAMRRDEIGELAAAFDHMAHEVTRRDEEIRAWNADLERRVQEKTAALKAAQDQVLRARRLAAVGSLAAGIAHEINNPLTAVVGLVSIVRKNVGAASRDGDLLGSALEQATRVARVVEHLREISERQRESAGVRFALSVPVQSALEAHGPEFERRRIAVESEFEPDLPDIQGDPVQMQQLVDHLVGNALDATPEGGSVRVHVSAVNGEAVRLAVTDTGVGIPAAVRERIFDPFFTSKPRGSLGLGLTLSNTIVDAHHGKLLVESSEGTGSTFTVLLPAAAAQAHLE